MATEGSLELEIVTPKGIVLREQVDEIIAPSVNGDFGVLPGHLPVLAALKTGLVRFKEQGKEREVAVGPGFVEVNRDKALLLTDRCIEKGAVDVLAVRERLKAVDDELDRWEGDLADPKRLELIEEEQWLAAQLELIGDPPVPTILEHSRAIDFGELLPETESEAPAEEPVEGREEEKH